MSPDFLFGAALPTRSQESQQIKNLIQFQRVQQARRHGGNQRGRHLFDVGGIDPLQLIRLQEIREHGIGFSAEIDDPSRDDFAIVQFKVGQLVLI